ncbi:hypothetical protein EXIGLDRAFT_836082 [Exidia glandulosa HHB12029]|uniref:Uncharacterized protein n=1 Tax=Exidia glandulosa HHB12029 TaxID=1314781 RepID=A0A165I5I0_EXIGL|nr:hypothetical protein EXIGLDRAFT_836082 [Exidia glandulosa HHB12029]
MALKLPDETLAAIMALHLTVPDAAFTSTDYLSPFSRIEQSSSTLLCVCKRFMRVATPLLYETVILRSTAQAQALAAALKANKDFGRFIKKLRVEGGYGASVEKIMVAAPNITDFAMTLKLWANDNVRGMCKAMHNINPRRVVLISLNDSRDNVSTRNATDTLCACFESWTRLTTVILPANEFSLDYGPAQALVPAMKKCPTLREVGLRGEPHRPHRILNELAAIPSLEVLDVTWSEADMTPQPPLYALAFGIPLPSDQHKLSAEANTKIRYAPERHEPRRPIFPRMLAPSVIPDPLPPLDPSWRPFANASDDVRASLWTNILEHVIRPARGSLLPYQHALMSLLAEDSEFDEDSDMEQSFYGSDSEDSMDYPFLHRRPKRYGPAVSCMLVCKEFASIATKVACQELVLASHPAIISFYDRLNSDPSLAAHVESIRLQSQGMSSASIKPILNALLERLTNLKRVSLGSSLWTSVGLDYSSLEALSVGAAATLTQMDNMFFSGVGNIDALTRFTALKVLEWEGAVALKTVPDDADAELCLPALEKLVLRSSSPSFLRALARCELPVLATLVLHLPTAVHLLLPAEKDALDEFLDAHGSGITKVVQDKDSSSFVLEKCPNVVELVFTDAFTRYSDTRAVELKDPHKSLKRIQLPHLSLRKGLLQWRFFLDSLNDEMLPALRTISIADLNFWPTTQREIAKSVWPPIAERLLECGIKMVDGEGIAWRPRLQSSSTRRR